MITTLLQSRLGNSIRSATKRGLKSALRSRYLRRLLYDFFLLSLEDEVPWHWKGLEPIYAQARRRLYRSRMWRYGPLFVRRTSKPLFDILAEHNVSIKDKVYCDLGCGIHHPYGSSAVMYINGAASAIATDLKGTDEKRAAEALHDLLLDCLANPNDWHWSNLTRGEYLARVRSFDLKALRDGDLKAGLGSVPIEHIVANIYETTIQPESIEIMSSRAVLEHLLDFELACSKLYALMTRGSLAYHLVDLVDHRAYGSSKYHWWSFLAESEHWSDDLCNRLRPGEIREHLEEAGFEIVSCDPIDKAEMPVGFRKQLKGRFASMPDEELRVIRVAFLVKKP